MTMAQRKTAEPAQVIDGKAAAKKLRDSIKRHVEVLVSDHKILPGLAVVVVGDETARAVYVNKNEKAAQ
jgi:methylenetetrahydrofolate dehydrogenase (NADP+)/methenyltetrahydrofolate cyclohydrolase